MRNYLPLAIVTGIVLLFAGLLGAVHVYHTIKQNKCDLEGGFLLRDGSNRLVCVPLDRVILAPKT